MATSHNFWSERRSTLSPTSEGFSLLRHSLTGDAANEIIKRVREEISNIERLSILRGEPQPEHQFAISVMKNLIESVQNIVEMKKPVDSRPQEKEDASENKFGL